MTGRDRHEPRDAGNVRDPHERRDGSTRPARTLVDDVRPTLRHASPVELVLLAAAVVEASTPRPTDQPGSRHPSLAGLVDGLITGGTPEGRALAHAMLPMIDDQVLSRRTARAVGPVPSTPAPMRPRWLADVTSLAVTDVFGRDDMLVIGLGWPDGIDATIVVSLTVGPPPAIVDAETVALPVALVRDLLDGPTPALALRPIPATVAHDQLVAAIIAGVHGGLPSAGARETWPMARPFVEWVTRRLVNETLRPPPRS